VVPLGDVTAELSEEKRFWNSMKVECNGSSFEGENLVSYEIFSETVGSLLE